MIGNVFDAGFRMGHLAARMEAEEEREENIEEKGRHWPA
jgi:hypothetical protein